MSSCNIFAPLMEIRGQKILPETDPYSAHHHHPCQKQRPNSEQATTNSIQRCRYGFSLRYLVGDTNHMKQPCGGNQEAPYKLGNVPIATSCRGLPISVPTQYGIFETQNLGIDSGLIPQSPSVNGASIDRKATMETSSFHPRPDGNSADQQVIWENQLADSQPKRRSKWSKVEQRTTHAEKSEWVAFLSDCYRETSQSGALVRVYQQRPYNFLQSSMIVTHLPCIYYTALDVHNQTVSSPGLHALLPDRGKVLSRQLKTMTKLGIERPIQSAPPQRLPIFTSQATTVKGIGKRSNMNKASSGTCANTEYYVSMRNRLGKINLLTKTPVQTLHISAEYFWHRKCFGQFKAFSIPKSVFIKNHGCPSPNESQEKSKDCRPVLCEMCCSSGTTNCGSCKKLSSIASSKDSSKTGVSDEQRQNDKPMDARIMVTCKETSQGRNNESATNDSAMISVRCTENSAGSTSGKENAVENDQSKTYLSKSVGNRQQAENTEVTVVCVSPDRLQGETVNASSLSMSHESGGWPNVDVNSQKGYREKIEASPHRESWKIPEETDRQHYNLTSPGKDCISVKHLSTCYKSYPNTPNGEKCSWKNSNPAKVVDTFETSKKVDHCTNYTHPCNATVKGNDTKSNHQCKLRDVFNTQEVSTAERMDMPINHFPTKGLTIKRTITAHIFQHNVTESKCSRVQTNSNCKQNTPDFDTVVNCHLTPFRYKKGKESFDEDKTTGFKKINETTKESDALSSYVPDKERGASGFRVVDRSQTTVGAPDEKRPQTFSSETTHAFHSANTSSKDSRCTSTTRNNAEPIPSFHEVHDQCLSRHFDNSFSTPRLRHFEKGATAKSQLNNDLPERSNGAAKLTQVVKVGNQSLVPSNTGRASKLVLPMKIANVPNASLMKTSEVRDPNAVRSKLTDAPKQTKRTPDGLNRLHTKKHLKSITERLGNKTFSKANYGKGYQNVIKNRARSPNDTLSEDFEEVEDYQWVSREVKEEDMKDGVSILERQLVKLLVPRQKDITGGRTISKDSKLVSKVSKRPVFLKPPCLTARPPMVHVRRRLTSRAEIMGTNTSRHVAPCQTVDMNFQAEISAAQTRLQDLNMMPPRRKGRAAISSPETLGDAFYRLSCESRKARRRQAIANFFRASKNECISKLALANINLDEDDERVCSDSLRHPGRKVFNQGMISSLLPRTEANFASFIKPLPNTLALQESIVKTKVKGSECYTVSSNLSTDHIENDAILLSKKQDHSMHHNDCAAQKSKPLCGHDKNLEIEGSPLREEKKQAGANLNRTSDSTLNMPLVYEGRKEGISSLCQDDQTWCCLSPTSELSIKTDENQKHEMSLSSLQDQFSKPCSLAFEISRRHCNSPSD
ncbi:hypothetical protein ElyMa_003309600 [Elysia marginata]|uniref:Uncharacterized protein n=1 Tax=Elysia marginata TaxID=1093978 RepID=A0AAV4JI71_9GAST|nr:hypothetical protein ElyMa_003309600 [Elysia marginata]